MNDFTKKELEDLFDCCKAAYIAGNINPQKPLQIKAKIQSMLENYGANDGDITFSIRFELKSHIMKGQFSEFDCVEIGRDIFEPTRVYQSKKEAIDSLINSLLKIKDIDAEL